MMSRATVLEFMRMTPAERFELARALQDEAEAQIASLPPAERELRWRILRRQHDQFGERVLAHLAQYDR